LKKILIVINYSSGVGAAKAFHDRIELVAQKNDLQYEVYQTTGNNDHVELKRLIKKHKPEIVFAVGGDGTVNMVASELVNTGIILGIFPAGSANGLAYNLGISNDVENVISNYLFREPKLLDVIKINNKHFCFHLADIGVNARIVSRFEKEGSKGMLGYGKHLIKEMSGKKNWFSFYINIPGFKRRKMKAEMLVFANAKSYGTGASINPTGKLNDGKFEIIILRPYPWWFVFTFIYAVFTGKLHRMKYIKVYSVTQAKIELNKAYEMQIDGEIFPGVKTIRAEIMPGALKVLSGNSDRTEF